MSQMDPPGYTHRKLLKLVAIIVLFFAWVSWQICSSRPGPDGTARTRTQSRD